MDQFFTSSSTTLSDSTYHNEGQLSKSKQALKKCINDMNNVREKSNN